MLLKKSILFSFILLFFSISIYPSSENPPIPPIKDGPPSLIPTVNERDELVKTFLLNYKKSASQHLLENIVELTDGYTIIQITGLVVDIISVSA